MGQFCSGGWSLCLIEIGFAQQEQKLEGNMDVWQRIWTDGDRGISCYQIWFGTHSWGLMYQNKRAVYVLMHCSSGRVAHHRKRRSTQLQAVNMLPVKPWLWVGGWIVHVCPTLGCLWQTVTVLLVQEVTVAQIISLAFGVLWKSQGCHPVESLSVFAWPFREKTSWPV